MSQRDKRSLSSLAEVYPDPFIDERSIQPPCQAACPVHQDVQRYISFIAQGEFDQALKVIRETNPLPFICGMVCVHPCESECRRQQVDQSLSIRALKRFALEHGRDSTLTVQSQAKRSERVAIIGSGPAGLSAAFYLTKLGYPVTIFEALPLPGGMMRVGIPEYRLPKAILDAEIEGIKSIGVDIRTNVRVEFLDTLFEQGYKAIFIAIGAHQGVRMGIEGEDSAGVIECVFFLKQVNLGEKMELGDRVAIIGGGDAAMDSARTALRVGAKEATIIYRRTQAEMPASAEEIERALEEGVKILFLAAPSKITRQNGLLRLECLCMKLGKPDDSGRRRPEPIKGSEFTMDFNTIIAAIGQTPEILKQFKLATGRGNTLQVDPDTLSTTREGIFAGGDAVSGPASVVKAIAAGKQAASSIDRYLKGEVLAKPEEQIMVGKLSASTGDKIERQERLEVPSLAVEQRVRSFAQIELGYSEETAIREARRCLSCGAGAERLAEKCADCLTCVRICRYGAPYITSDGSVEISVDQCQACGICFSECPAKAISFRSPVFEEIIQEIETASEELRLKEGEPAIIGITCSYGAYAKSSFTEFLRTRLPSNVRIVRIPCVAKIDTAHLLKAFELGIDGVFLASCLEEDCPYQDGVSWARRRVDTVRKILGEIGLGEGRLEMYSLPVPEVGKFGQVVASFAEQLKSLLSTE